ncbi:hypothetical protein NKT34_08770 [Paenibacillus polysaccharolyticus]|uniref:hypothetical protein n=1 Tax=Paenibacillus polysaccharolyticus TaxID=582692 RepID=UPI00209FFED7|nr:hypothetical protein [Paenibacillus polysaccharolyticus]MCP1133381.1 hypothetical protein [Paenibacillus polysaccharolyticus]
MTEFSECTFEEVEEMFYRVNQSIPLSSTEKTIDFSKSSLNKFFSNLKAVLEPVFGLIEPKIDFMDAASRNWDQAIKSSGPYHLA